MDKRKPGRPPEPGTAKGLQGDLASNNLNEVLNVSRCVTSLSNCSYCDDKFQIYYDFIKKSGLTIFSNRERRLKRFPGGTNSQKQHFPFLQYKALHKCYPKPRGYKWCHQTATLRTAQTMLFYSSRATCCDCFSLGKHCNNKPAMRLNQTPTSKSSNLILCFP